MAKKSESVTDPSKPVMRYVLWTIGALSVMIALLVAFNRTENFLITDSRFVLPGLPDGLTGSPNFRIEGARYASELQIAAVFAKDFGRSLYLCPIAERRRQLLAVSWVREASVSRIWPNSVIVRIQERSPVAFVQFTSHGGTRWGLIDGEGVFLDPQRSIKFKLPVLTGMKLNETEKARQERITRLQRLQQELGSLMDRISEVDVADPDNIRVTTQMDGRAVTLMLGNQSLRLRMENFLNNYVEIRKRMPSAKVLDCRLPDRITAVEESSNRAE
jgi:cell division protein FtsQ